MMKATPFAPSAFIFRFLPEAGMALMSAGLFILSVVRWDSAYATILIGLLGMGVGTALVFGPIMSLAASSISAARSGTSSGMVNVGRMVGATLGVAIPGSIFGGRVMHASQGTTGFMSGMHLALMVGASLELAGAVLAVAFVKGSPSATRIVQGLREAFGRT
jgi:MFS transporter, DHA2 family, methylenomycin A resistance protein